MNPEEEAKALFTPLLEVSGESTCYQLPFWTASEELSSQNREKINIIFKLMDSSPAIQK